MADPHLMARLASIDTSLSDLHTELTGVRSDLSHLRARVVGISVTASGLVSIVGFLALRTVAA